MSEYNLAGKVRLESWHDEWMSEWMKNFVIVLKIQYRRVNFVIHGVQKSIKQFICQVKMYVYKF